LVKIVATRCQILRLKRTKIDFDWGSTPDLAGGAYSAPPYPQLYLRGLLLRRRRGKGRGGKGGENDLTHPLSQIPGYATATNQPTN